MIAESRVRLRCGDPVACGELAEFISSFKGARSPQITYRVRDGILEAAIVGPPSEVARAKRALMEAYRKWREIREFRSGRSSELRLEALPLLTGRPTAPRILVQLLRAQGYAAELREGVLTSNAPPDLIVELARKISEKMEGVARDYPRATHSLKALLVALSVLGYDTESVLEDLKRAGLVEEDHKLKLNAEWGSLLIKVHTSSLGVERGEAGDQEG